MSGSNGINVDSNFVHFSAYTSDNSLSPKISKLNLSMHIFGGICVAAGVTLICLAHLNIVPLFGVKIAVISIFIGGVFIGLPFMYGPFVSREESPSVIQLPPQRDPTLVTILNQLEADIHSPHYNVVAERARLTCEKSIKYLEEKDEQDLDHRFTHNIVALRLFQLQIEISGYNFKELRLKANEISDLLSTLSKIH